MRRSANSECRDAPSWPGPPCQPPDREGTALKPRVRLTGGGSAANEDTPAQNVKGSGPLMRVNWRALARPEGSIKHPDRVILQEHVMVMRCRTHRVERIRRLESSLRRGRFICHPFPSELRADSRSS